MSTRLPQTIRKLLFLPFWLLATLLTLGSAAFLLIVLGSAITGSAGDQAASAYRLFSALPKTGQVLGTTIFGKDARVEILTEFFAQYRSPLVPYAANFVEAADKNRLPWTLLPAICGKESGFGKTIPFGSFNCFGWGVYTGQKSGVSFASWEDSIEKVAQAVRRDYFNRGLDTVDEIERIYTPQSPEKGHPWRDGVNYFIWELENWR